MTVTQQLAEFVAATPGSAIPPETVDTAKGLLLKTVAGMVVGCREPVGRTVTEYLQRAGGAPEAAVVGAGYHTTVENAAWAHGVFAHASELEDDQFPSTVGDYWVFPALFSLAEKLGSSGRELIDAAIIGWEVGTRLIDEDRGLFYRGVKIEPVLWFAPIATAAAAARLLKLPADQAANALSISMVHQSGFWGQFGSTAHFIETGGVQRAGVLSALLAKENCTGQLDILDGAGGHFAAVWEGRGVDLKEALGKPPWAVHNMWVKKFPCCLAFHVHIDALMMLLRDHALRNDDIEAVEVEIDLPDSEFVGGPADNLDAARFSVAYALAEVLLRGTVDLESFKSEGRLTAPATLEAMAKVKVIPREDWPTILAHGGQVTIVTKDGRRLTQFLRTALGGTDSPLSLDEVARVSRPYLEAFLAVETARRVEEILVALDTQGDVRELMDLLSTRARV
jgi:2-methylcitrate dehydratase PrpD